jgi:hypothetical protein
LKNCILISLFILCSSSLGAQINKLPCDTCLQTKLKQQKEEQIQRLEATKDSSLAKGKQQTLAKQKEFTEKATAKKEGIKQTITNKTDSTARANKKAQIKGKGKEVLASEKGKLNESKNKIKTLSKNIFESPSPGERGWGEANIRFNRRNTLRKLFYYRSKSHDAQRAHV